MRSTMLTPFQAMDALMHGFGTAPRGDAADAAMKPRVDILENENSYRVEADLPGVVKEDLKVELENGVLVIEAERKKMETEGYELRRVERLSTARYRRTFTVGDEIDLDQISAEFHNGVLSLTLPKREKALPRRIEIR